MKRLINHIMAMFVTLLVFAPVFASQSIGRMMKESAPWMNAAFFANEGPSISSSIFVVGLVLTFLAMVIFAPVSSIANYLIENRYMVPTLAEPLITIGVLAIYITIPALLMKCGKEGIWWQFYVSMMITYTLPTLLYWVMLRLASNWEYER